MAHKQENQYKVAEITLTSSGQYRLIWTGTHPDQGGLTYRMGSIGFTTLGGLAGNLVHFLGRDEEKFKELIAAKEEEENVKGS